MPLANTTNGAIFYADHRDPTVHRPPIVWIHGAGGSHLDWPAELRRLPEGNGIVLALPGHSSSPGSGRDSVIAYAADVIALMDALKIKQAILAGMSLGGAIAQMIALRYADRVTGLILIATAAKLTVRPELQQALSNDHAKAIDLIINAHWGENAPEQVRRLSQKRLAEIPLQVLQADYRAVQHFDVRDQLHRINIPTLIIGGTQDQITPFAESEYLHNNISGSELVKIEGAGHMLVLEQPQPTADAVARWLSRF
jgi:pimeloyl-ACP methyl ester carboxylesterase